MTSTAAMPVPRPPPATELTKLAGLKLGNYRLERLVGQGRMGVVYLAKDEALLRPTAVKVLSWSKAEAQGHDPVKWFLAEARLVARINHPCVVQIYGAARQGEYCYLAMEYVDGASAEVLVSRAGRMAPELATEIVLQAASALQAAHAAGVVHRDVKPANLLVATGGGTKLGDFGMAFGSADDGHGHARLRVGTPAYTAPEIWRGEAASPASDLYALGASYFQLLTGRPPYPAPDVAAVEQAHLRGRVPDPRELVPALPASCAALVLRALAKAPRERHGSAQLLHWEARRILRDLSSSQHAPAAPRRAAPPPPQPAAPALPVATGPLADAFGFQRRPFCDDPATWPLPGEPLAAVPRRLAERVDDEATGVVVLVGEEGSGRAALCRRAAAEAARSRLVVAAEAGEGAGAVLRRVCRALGIAEGASPEASLEALVERLGEAREQHDRSPLVVLDGLGAPVAPEVASLVSAGLWTRAFKTLLGGGPGVLEALAEAGLDPRDERMAAVAVEPFDPARIPGYVRSWLAATLAPDAKPIIFSPDALRLLALRSAGALERLNCIAENMLVLAAKEGRRIVTSWHAWAAPDRERWADAGLLGPLPRRPEPWPPPEVTAVIDACRRGAGLPPWPRGAG